MEKIEHSPLLVIEDNQKINLYNCETEEVIKTNITIGIITSFLDGDTILVVRKDKIEIFDINDSNLIQEIVGYFSNIDYLPKNKFQIVDNKETQLYYNQYSPHSIRYLMIKNNTYAEIYLYENRKLSKIDINIELTSNLSLTKDRYLIILHPDKCIIYDLITKNIISEIDSKISEYIQFSNDGNLYFIEYTNNYMFSIKHWNIKEMKYDKKIIMNIPSVEQYYIVENYNNIFIKCKSEKGFYYYKDSILYSVGYNMKDNKIELGRNNNNGSILDLKYIGGNKFLIKILDFMNSKINRIVYDYKTHTSEATNIASDDKITLISRNLVLIDDQLLNLNTLKFKRVENVKEVISFVNSDQIIEMIEILDIPVSYSIKRIITRFI